jgi:multiple sugar transport system ATP-binding protein
MASVQIEQAKKAYGATQVLHGVDVQIADGEFCVLVGPSGCGKSTLLRMIAGLEEISAGTIRIGERVVNDVPPKERDIAMVFQNYALYPHMTVRENMAFSLTLAKKPREEIDRRVNDAAQILGLGPYLDRQPRALSGGQRQRVAMGRAIVRNPQVFLFDEPLSNLDAKLRVQMRTEIKALHQRLKTTSVYVTHDQIEAMTMADRIVVMRDGRVEQIGSPLELYDHPVNTFVAGFIGSPAMNLITSAVTQGRLSIEGQMLSIQPAEALAPGRQVLMGIRPEHIQIGRTATELGAQPALQVEVEVVEPTGADTQVFCKLGNQSIMAAVRERIDAKPGDHLWLAPDLAHIHLFDAQTNQRI